MADERPLRLRGDHKSLLVRKWVAWLAAMVTLTAFVDAELAMKQQAKLLANDATADLELGLSMDISGTSLLVGGHFDKLATPASTSAYVWLAAAAGDPAAWSQQASLDVELAGTSSADDWFATSVALSGNTAVLGASGPWHASHAGAASILVRSGSIWSKQAGLVDSDSAVGDNFGFSVALSGETAVVGAPAHSSFAGMVSIFVRNSGGTWSLQTRLKTPGGGTAPDYFGYSIALSSDTLLVGAPKYGGAGSAKVGTAYIFARSGVAWSLQAEVSGIGLIADDEFGHTVALLGDTALVGSLSHNFAAGAVYVFRRSGNTWSQEAKLVANDANAGSFFGSGIDMVGETVLVGALAAGPAGSKTGSAYIFVRSGSAWRQEAQLRPNDGADGYYFGASVALSDAVAVVGAHRTGSAYGVGLRSGSAYIFSWDQCTHQTCGRGFMLTPNPPARCTGPVCTQEQCCDELDTCADFCDLNFALKISLPDFCGATNCTHSECCDPQDRCAASDCGEGFVQKPLGPNHLCNTPACTQGECCSPLARCAAADCPSNDFVLKLRSSDGLSLWCNSSSCTLAECCEPVGECKESDCDRSAGYVLTQPDPVLKCVGAVCTQGECCDRLPFCNETVCSGGADVLKLWTPVDCGGGECTRQQCCDKKAVCGMATCGAGKTIMALPPQFCNQKYCTQEECCQQAPSCGLDMCAKGFKLKDEPPMFCHSAICTQSECCVELDTCEATDCAAGYVLHTSKPTHCATWVCSHAECCGKAGTCSVERCENGYVLKDYLPSMCNSTTCMLEECCQVVIYEPPIIDAAKVGLIIAAVLSGIVSMFLVWKFCKLWRTRVNNRKAAQALERERLAKLPVFQRTFAAEAMRGTPFGANGSAKVAPEG